MGEEWQDTAGPPPIQDHRRVSVQEAAEHLGSTVDAIRKRVQRGTIAHEKASDGRVWILMDTDMPGRDTDQDKTGQRQDTDRPQSDSTALISAKDETIATLKEQLEAERQAHAEARRIIAGLVERIPPAIEPPREAPGGPEAAREAPEASEPRSATGGAQEATQSPQAPRSLWSRIFGGS